MRRILRLPGLVLLLLVGCSRALPDPSPGSAIDPESPAPEPIAVGVALRGDPPLPAESPESDPHRHHHHGKSAKPAAEGGEHDH